jgi:hypothetical protein
LNAALAFSLLAHTLLLSITLGGQTFGLPGLNFPWKERRLDASDLQIRFATALPATALATTATAVITAVDRPPAAVNATALTMPLTAINRREAAAAAPAPPMPAAAPEPAMTAPNRPPLVAPVATATPALLPAPPLPSQVKETPADASDAARKEIDQAAQERALERARIELEGQSAERLRQAALIAAAQREAARQEQLRQEARAEQTARSEAARIEVERQELARQEGLRAEAARLEAARRDAMRQEQARQAQLEAARQAAAKQEAARQDRARQELAQRELSEQEAQREERLRAIGKQLNAEAAQRDAASNAPSRSLLPTVSGLRRGWLLGRADANNDLVLYAEAMSRKIELNQTFDLVRAAIRQPHTRPMVTVAVRADGSVEKVTFDVSSGVAAIDDAIRKVVASQAPYPAFPPAIARHYDVIEIRRTWSFDTAIRLQ